MYEQNMVRLSSFMTIVLIPPFDHRIVLSKLTIELGVLFYHAKTIQLVPLRERPWTKGRAFPYRM